MNHRNDFDNAEASVNPRRRKDALTGGTKAVNDTQQRTAPSQVIGGSPILRAADDVLALQQTVGNQAVGRALGQQSAIQRKGDKNKGDTATIDTTIAAEHNKYTPNFAKALSTDAPTSYKVTVAVSQSVPEYLTFAKTRMKSTVRNKVRAAVRTVPGMSLGVRKPKSSGQIKEKAAVKAAGKAKGTPATDPAVDNILQNSDSVGHSWIKMSPVGATGPIQTYSFGFIPADTTQAHGPQQAIPGQVRNPDMEFEKYADHTSRFLDTTVNASSYHKALSKIAALMGAPPAYMTIGYNCTQFTKDIAQAAGATFPGKAGMMIPISDRGFRKRALSPNALYEKLGNDLNTQDQSTEQTMLQDPNGGFYEGAGGIAQGGGAVSLAPRGLQLVDLMADENDPNGTVSAQDDDMLVPTGNRQGSMIEVRLNGKTYFADEIGLKKHLKQQSPEDKSVHTIFRALTINTRGGPKTLAAPRKIAAVKSDGDTIAIDGGLPDRPQGTAKYLAFWQAVGNVELGADDSSDDSSMDSDW